MPQALGAVVGGVTGSSLAGGIASGVGSMAMGGGGKKGGHSGGGGRLPGGFIQVPGGYTVGIDQPTGRMMAYDDPARIAMLNSIQKSYTDQAGTLRGMVPGINSAYGTSIDNIKALLDQVKPGFGSITDALVNQIQNAGNQAGSDLRSSLAKRRVLGSSFGDAAQSSQALDVGQKLAEAKANGFLAEMDATNQLHSQMLTQQLGQINDTASKMMDAFTSERAGTQTQIEEQNRLGAMAQALMSAAMEQAQKNTALQLDAAKSQGALSSNAFSSFDKYVAPSINSFFNPTYTGTQSGANYGTIAWN